MVPLRHFQADLEAAIYREWQTKRNVLAVSATGSGKTVVMSKILHDYPGASVAIAHRRELVSQISVALARNGVRHRIIAPKTVQREISSLHMLEVKRNYVDRNSRTAVAGVDTLINMDASDPWFRSVGLWVTDECFPAGTLIDGRPIETVRVGDYVSAFNEHTNEIESRQVARLFKNPLPKYMMRVTIAHHALECTKGHPFWTKRGWIEAEKLQIDDEVLYDEMHLLRQFDNRNDRITTISAEENRTNILYEKMRNESSRNVSSKTKTYSPSGCYLYDVFEPCGFKWASIRPLQKNRPCVLQHDVQSRVSRTGVFGNNGANKPKIRIRENDPKQSNAQRSVDSENVGNFTCYRTQAKISRRQWAAPESCRITAVQFIWRNGVCDATCNPDGANERWIPACVQTGSRPLEVQDFNRRGRGEPCAEIASGSRREKRRMLTWTRVDRVEIYECRDRNGSGIGNGDGFVYNLEVEGLHTYFANGVVVHNCHHLLAKNKWGTAAAMFPNAHGLGVTATPMRADGKGLGRHADGVIDAMVVAPNMRDLITMGYLTGYRLIAPPTDLDLSDVPVGESGEYVQVKLAAAVHKSRITGDAVAAYQKYAAGKLGITFCVDVEAATEQAAAYRSAGVPSEVITSKTPDGLRLAILRRFKARELLQLVNVDLFGEGYDLPAIEAVTMCRPTASLTLFYQQFGRGLRLMVSDELNAAWESYTPAERHAHIATSGKPSAIIIDHVGNYLRHGLPDAPRVWSLDRRERRSRSTPTDVIPLRSCPQCAGTYERAYVICPYCGFKPIPSGRLSPEQVDGDLSELDPEVLAFLRGELAKAESGFVPIPAGATPEVIGACNKRHRERQAAQAALRAAMMLWGGHQKALGRDESEAQRRFWFRYGIDVANAQLLGRADAEALTVRINADLLTMTTVTDTLTPPITQL